jgi:5-formyltetrahydrofolate cyclo-ligase
MNSDLADSKKKLRADIRARLQNISAAVRENGSATACQLLRQQSVWQQARSILFYVPMPDEIDVRILLQETISSKKTVALPRFEPGTNCYVAHQIQCADKDLAPGKFGILEPRPSCEPVPLNHLDFVLVPGVAFNSVGARLGRGRGFYDRLLARVAGVKCGIAFDEQLVDEIPAEPHDMKMNYIVTPTRWLKVS